VVVLDFFQTEPYFLFFYPVIVLILAIDNLLTGQLEETIRLAAKFLVTVGLFALTDLFVVYETILAVVGHPFYGHSAISAMDWSSRFELLLPRIPW
jgi:hypothetical protein